MVRRGWLVLVLSVLGMPLVPTAVQAASRHPTRPTTFPSCAGLVSYAQKNFAVTHGVPEPSVAAFDTAPPPAARVPIATGQPGTSQQTAAAAPVADGAPAAAGAPAYSTTNVQEAGVDEPDTAKTDGRTLFTISQGKLFAVSVTGTPKLVGSLDIGSDGYGAQLLLRGSRLIVISSGGAAYAFPVGVRRRAAALPAYPFPSTTVREVDVHDPTAMRVTRTMSIDGAFVDARQNGATARLVISSVPRGVEYVPGLRATPAAWVPSRHFHSALTGRTYVRPVAPCTTIRRPPAFSGLGMLTIFTLDLDRGLYTADTQALMADAQVVYGSTTSLYVATQRWVNPQLPLARVPGGQATLISRFDVSDPARTTLVASGAVPGYVLNQFALSEYKGYLRVATTSRPIWWQGGPPAASQSQVTVLGQRAGNLQQVGQVSGLGAGQQIYSVRFVDDAGYVVTFRQIDPLYTLDLHNPAAPRVAGQLELEGYSSYLHPLAPGLLLGVGQDVGGNEPSGAQLELFDVSNPSAPRLVQKTTLGNGSSTDVQYDHHAFLFWSPTGLAVLPVQIYGGPIAVQGGGGVIPPGAAIPSIAPIPPFVGAIGYHIDRNGITEVGRITHPASNGYAPTISRSIVVGDQLFTVSDAGVLDSTLNGLAPGTFVAFPAVAQPPGPIPLPAASAPAR